MMPMCRDMKRQEDYEILDHLLRNSSSHVRESATPALLLAMWFSVSSVAVK